MNKYARTISCAKPYNVRSILLLLFLLLLIHLINPLSFPPIESVTSHNMEIAQFLINSTLNVGGAPISHLTVDNPVSFFSIRAFTAIPSVDTRISSNHIPSILWGWGEEHREKVEEMKEGHPECPKATIAVESMGEPTPGEFYALVRFQGDERKVDLLNGSKNPFNIPFSKEEIEAPIEKDSGTNKSIPLYVNITITGSIDFPYKKTEHTYRYECETVCINETHCIEVCTCYPVTYESNLTITKTASSSTSFQLENGNVLFFLLRPILREQLGYKSEVSAVIFSKRLPYKTYLKFDDRAFNAVYTHSFSINKDEFGVKYINSTEHLHKGVQSDDKDAPDPININSSLSSSSLETYIQPIQLEKENESFSHIYNINASYANMSGRHNFSVIFFDHFNDQYEYNASILTRTMTVMGIERKQGGITITLSNGKGNPLPNKRITVLLDGTEHTHSTDSRGVISIPRPSHFISASFPGDEEYRPSSNYLMMRAQGSPIDFFAFGFLIILLALFAGVSFYNTGSIFPFSWLQGIWKGIRKLFPGKR